MILGPWSPRSRATKMIWNSVISTLKAQIHLRTLRTSLRTSRKSLPLPGPGFGFRCLILARLQKHISFKAGVIPSRLSKTLRAKGGLDRGLPSQASSMSGASMVLLLGLWCFGLSLGPPTC